MNKILNYLLITLLCLSLQTAIAQEYNFKTYGTKNGLVGTNVLSIFQDSKGYIWFGAEGGVSRFDGVHFINFTKQDGLVGNQVTTINEDKQGNIWFGTNEGVSKYDGSKFYNYTTKQGLGDNYIRNIFVDNNNILWFASDTGGVARYDGKTFKIIDKSSGLQSNTVYAVTQDKQGSYWFALDTGVAKYDGAKIINYHEGDMKKRKFFSGLTDWDGNIWFAGVGIVKYDGKEFKQFVVPEELKGDFFQSILEDNKHNIWFASDKHGALKYNVKEDKFTLFSEKNRLSSNNVLSLCSDYEGNIWLGTQSGGVNLFNNESFVNYTDKQGLSNNKVSAVFTSSSGLVLIGTQGFGINVMENGHFNPTTSFKELAHAIVLSITENKKEEIWVGTDDKGIFVYKKNGNSYVLKEQIKKYEKESHSVIKILFDKLGNTWLADFGGGLICITEKGIVKNYNTDNKFPSDNILTIFEDSKGNIWVGTFDNGIVKFSLSSSTNSWEYTVMSEREGLPDKEVWSIAEDNKHNMYFGTKEGGLSCYDGKRYRTINTKDGLCSNYIEAMAWDEAGKCLWLGTNNGINKLQIADSNQVLSISTRYFGEQQGFKGEEVNQNSIFIDKQGLVWFGTINGLFCYNSKYDYPNITAPKLRLNEVLLNNKAVDWKTYTDSIDLQNNLPKKLELSYKNNHLTFHFQALTTDNVKYQYLLEGQDNEWSPLSSSTEANFTNITPGKSYTFKVKAVNSNGVQSNSTVEFKFTINAPWYQTWWFYALILVVVMFSVYLFIHYRTSQLAREKKVLEDKVTERTIDLRTANKKLSLAFQDIKDSINYARIIQDAILPFEEEIKEVLPQSFVLYKPRDIVSGDFYWFYKKENKIFIAAVDCTGHGVPGAFMSMIGSSLLNEIVNEKELDDVAGILKKLHIGVRKALKQDRGGVESKDGMDLALACINFKDNTLEYSGAKRPLFWFRNSGGESIFEEIKANKQSIGGHQAEEEVMFTNRKINFTKGDTFYLFTDGYVDQFGGEKEKKFSSKRLKDILSEIQALSMAEQQHQLNKTIDDWKINTEQVDDILIIGIRI